MVEAPAADAADRGVTGASSSSPRPQAQPHLRPVLHRALVDHRLDVRDDRRADERVTVPGRAAVPAVPLEHLRDLVRRRRRRREGCSVHALADRHQVRHDAVVELVREPLAEPAEAADHLVVHPEDAVTPRQLSYRRDVVVMSHDPADAEHRLGDHRGDVVGPNSATSVPGLRSRAARPTRRSPPGSGGARSGRWALPRHVAHLCSVLADESWLL